MMIDETIKTRWRRLRPLLAIASVLALALGCASDTPKEGSSSSHWIRCGDDDDCASVADASCSTDGYCVGEDGDRIRVDDDSDVGTVSNPDDDVPEPPPELTDCNPLGPWQRDLDVDDPIVVARSDDGVVYAVTELDGEYVAWRSTGDTLQPLAVRGSGASGDELTLYVGAPDEDFTLWIAPETEPSSASLFVGVDDDDRELDPELGDTLTLLDEGALADFEVLPLEVLPQVEAHASGREGEDEALVMSPEWGGAYEDFRLFIGDADALSERVIESVVRARDGGTTTMEFVGEGGETRILNVASPITGGGGASLGENGEEGVLWARSSTALALSRLTFECLEPLPRRFELTNAAPEPPPAECEGERIPMGACLHSSVAVAEGEVGSSSVTVAGTVQAIGTGLPPAEAMLPDGTPVGCPFGRDVMLRFGDMYEGEENITSELQWVHVASDDAETWLSLRVGDASMPFEVGRQIEIALSAQFDFGGAIDSSLEVRDTDGAPVFWLGQSYSLDDLNIPPELSLAAGRELCTLSDTCALDYGYYELEASLGDDSITVAHGASAPLGEFLFTNAVHQIQTGSFVCTDSTAYFVRAALWR